MQKLVKGDKIGPYPYQIIKQLGEGEGGMSIVYLASIGEVDQPRKDQLVALKIADVQGQHREFYKQTLDNEVEHLCKLRHQGIVRLYKIRGQTLPPYPIYFARTNLTGTPWFSVMEYLAGGSLAELLKCQKKLDPGLALQITHKLAKTLEYIHHEGHVHLDIKPENVVFRQRITDAIDTVLIDFGIARAIGQEGLEGGTLLWSPPERVAFQNKHSLPPETMPKPHPSMDIYALGLLLYRMLAGKLPFQGSRSSITSAILKGNPTPPSSYESSLKPELDQLVLSAMSKRPHDRPTAAKFARKLEKLMTRPEYKNYKVPSCDNRNGGFLKSFMWFVLMVVIALGLFLYFQPQLIQGVKHIFVTSTMTPTIEVTATEMPPTATTIPSVTAIPTKTVSPTPSPSLSATTGATSTRVITFTPAPSATPIPSTSTTVPTWTPMPSTSTTVPRWTPVP